LFAYLYQVKCYYINDQTVFLPGWMLTLTGHGCL